jgi:hypothetical protein
MHTVDDNAWLGKAEAAALLGVSVRQLELKTAQGLVRKETLPKKPSDRAARVVYWREDLDAIRAGKPNRGGETKPAESETKALAREMPTSPDPVAALVAALARAFPAPAPPAQKAKPWLSLKDASDYSGLPARYLVQAAREGKMRAQNVGLKRDRWMFPREGLR